MGGEETYQLAGRFGSWICFPVDPFSHSKSPASITFLENTCGTVSNHRKKHESVQPIQFCSSWNYLTQPSKPTLAGKMEIVVGITQQM